jgi:hypothetical protein
MRYASKQDIKELIQTPSHAIAISIFLPTHRISLPHNLRADRVRMKNAIRDVVAKLEQMDCTTAEISSYVHKLHKIHGDQVFWKYRDNGLAIYAERDRLTYFDLPIEVDTSVHIGKDFIIYPLIASQGDSYKYRVLELNNNAPRVFIASQSGMKQILEDKMPGHIETALRIDEYQQQQQHATSSGGTRDGHSHGHGGEKDNKYKDVMKYYRLIDKVLWQYVLKNSTMPLILVGEESAVSQYRKISHYKRIYARSLHGNYEHLGENELHAKTWEIMAEQVEKQENIFKQLFEKAKNRDGRQALINGEHIRLAARQGRVATLAIGVIHKTYDSVVRRMEQKFKIALPSSKRQLMNIEQATRDVIMTGGDVSVLLQKTNGYGQNQHYIRAITR